MPTTYRGGCQCGNVHYEATMDELREATACNCSRCGRLGTLMAFVPTDAFRLEQGDGAMTEYRFNHHVIQHLFCTTCGVQSFARGKTPDGKEMIAINIRCLEGVDIDALPVKHFDGRNL